MLMELGRSLAPLYVKDGRRLIGADGTVAESPSGDFMKDYRAF
jgi:hypothetical protein